MRFKIAMCTAVVVATAFGPAVASQAKENSLARSDRARVEVTTRQLKKVADLDKAAMKSIDEKVKKYGKEGLEARIGELSASELEVLQTPITEVTEVGEMPVAESQSQPVLSGSSGNFNVGLWGCSAFTISKSTQNGYGWTIAYSAEVMTYYCPVSAGQITSVGNYQTANSHWGYTTCGWDSVFDYFDGFGHRYGGVSKFSVGPDCWFVVIQHSVEWAAGHQGSVYWWTN